MAEEEVPVLVVGVGSNFERGELASAFGTDGCGSGVFLRHDSLQFQFAELQVGAHAEQRTGTSDERRVGRHADVTGFDEFDDFVFFALIAQFDLLGVKVEGGFGVIVEVHVDFVADLTVQAEVYLFVEVESEDFSVSLTERGVVGEAGVGTDFEFCRTLGFDSDAAGTENLFEFSEREVHVGEVKLLFSFCLELLGVLLFVESTTAALSHEFTIFFIVQRERHIDIGRLVARAEFRAEEEVSALVVVGGFGSEVLGVFQVNDTVCCVGEGDESGLLDRVCRLGGKGGKFRVEGCDDGCVRSLGRSCSLGGHFGGAGGRERDKTGRGDSHCCHRDSNCY